MQGPMSLKLCVFFAQHVWNEWGGSHCFRVNTRPISIKFGSVDNNQNCPENTVVMNVGLATSFT
jgi:hypothetical protein